MSQWAEIRHMHLVDHIPEKKIARRLGINVKTVRAALKREDAPTRRQSPPRGRRLDPYRAEIEAWLKQEPKISAKRIGRLLEDQTGRIPERTVRQYVASVRGKLFSREAFVHRTHLLPSDPFGSVAGVGGSGISANGSALNGMRTYIWDQGAQPDLTDGLSVRGDSGFAMLVWDFGAAFDSMRLYTHQDHYSGGLITSNSVGQDVMEYSVWGSNDGNSFVLLSDVIGMNLNGGGAGLPTYTFAGTAPSIIYRGGSQENGIVNAYTREYEFSTAYRYYGIRTSQISLTIPGGGIDADPELDTIGAYKAADRDPAPVPEPFTVTLFAIGATAIAWRRRRCA